MTENKKEGGRAPDSDVEAVLNELEDEGHEIENRPPKTDDKEGEDKPKEDAEKSEDEKDSATDAPKPDEEAGKDETDKDKGGDDDDAGDKKPEDIDKPREPRRVKMMPAWEHEKTVNQLKSDHKKAMDDLKTSVDKPNSEDKADTHTPDRTEKIKTLAEKWKAEPEFIADLVDTLGTFEIPKAVEERLAKLDEIEANMNDQTDNADFAKEFDRDVTPLVKAEYANLPEKQLSELKARIREIAFSENYSTTPLSVIFKGLDEFRGLAKAPKKTAEAGKGGTEQAKKTVDTDGLSEDDVSEDNMSDEDFDKLLETKRGSNRIHNRTL